MSHGGPHLGLQPVTGGLPLAQAPAALVLVHGRGGSPEGMLDLASAIGGDDLAIVAPRASGGTWYPQSFLAPIEQNEPGLSSGLEALAKVLEDAEAAGIRREHQIVLGFFHVVFRNCNFIFALPPGPETPFKFCHGSFYLA